MSYILEAIKQSEQQRPRSRTAALRDAPMFADVAKRPPALKYGFVSSALIAAGIAIGWLHPWQYGGTSVTTAPIAPGIAESTPAQQAPAQARPSEPVQPVPTHHPGTRRVDKGKERHVMRVKPDKMPARTDEALLPARQYIPATLSVTPLEEPAVATLPAAQAEKEPAGRTARAATLAQAEVATASASTGETTGQLPGEGRILELFELPPDVLHAIPAMSFSGYSYGDNPKERMVSINAHLFQEGQYVANGIKLEQITPDGRLIFSYKNYRFRENLQ